MPKSDRPRNPNIDKRPNRYLAVHGGYWRVSMAVPKELQGELGTRLVRGLNTESVVIARIRREKVVAEFKARIEQAWAARGGRKRSTLAEAVEVRKLMSSADRNMQDFLQQGVNERAQEILEAGGVTWVEVIDEDFGGPSQHPVYTPEAIEEARTFRSVAAGSATPIALHHAEFMASLTIKDRSKLDEPRALSLLLDWMRANEIYPFIENVTPQVARQFERYLQSSTDLAWASKAKYLGRIKVYWAWLKKQEFAKENPFYDLTVKKQVAEAEAEEERPYTDTEVQRLFMGEPLEGRAMLDVMAVAALTGARLDAVISLKIGETDEGLFRFMKQKKEKTDRDVPIHPDLYEIVNRRAEVKGPEDDLFPEWPKPKPPSVKPRSSYFSKRFTFYSKKIGVRDEVENKRRSLVNFHSFRRWFITKLEHEGVNGDLIAAIVGHKRGGLTLDRYSSGPKLQAALEAISKVKLPPLDGTPVVETRGLKPIRRKP
ncbi:MAG TPA: tyrosine-type recombinase/integrase [Methylobacterium sp.]|jgi:integrase|nr:tyrosine-type recombinase/integrase [Methylobacterium sp.]